MYTQQQYPPVRRLYGSMARDSSRPLSVGVDVADTFPKTSRAVSPYGCFMFSPYSAERGEPVPNQPYTNVRTMVRFKLSIVQTSLKNPDCFGGMQPWFAPKIAVWCSFTLRPSTCPTLPRHFSFTPPIHPPQLQSS